MAYICKRTDTFSSFKLKTTVYFLSDLSDYDRTIVLFLNAYFRLLCLNN